MLHVLGMRSTMMLSFQMSTSVWLLLGNLEDPELWEGAVGLVAFVFVEEGWTPPLENT